MSYEKLGFVKGQKLKADHLNHMEEGIANAGGDTEVVVDYTVDFDNGGMEILSHTYDEVLQLIYEGKRVVLRERIKAEGNYVHITWFPLSEMTSSTTRGEEESAVRFMGLVSGALYSRYLFADNSVTAYNSTLLNYLDIGGSHFIMKSPSGEKRFRIRIDENGTLSTELIN